MAKLKGGLQKDSAPSAQRCLCALEDNTIAIAKPIQCDRLDEVDHGSLYELLISEVTDFAVFITDPNGCLASWNPGVERLLGYSEAEWLGESVHIIFTPEDRIAQKPEEEIAIAERNGRAPDVRWHQRKDGSRLFVEGTLVCLRDSQGTLLGFSKIMRDVTEREQSEARLRLSEQRLQTLISTSSEVLYRMSPDWSEMLQLGSGGFLVNTARPNEHWLSEYIDPADQPAVLDAIQKAIQTKSVFELEHRVRTADGTLGWTFSRAIPVLDASGQITEWFGAANDITARKKAEIFVKELARSNEDLSQFARIASHDLRAPLGTIIQLSQLLLKQYRGKILDGDAETPLNLVIASAERMLTLTSDLLSYAKVSSQPLVQAEPSFADEAFRDAIDNLKSEIEATAAVVICQPLPSVRLAPLLVCQLFQNLIANAIKYRGAESPRIHVAAQERTDDYLFSVNDNGIGIDPKYHRQIFAPFQRLHGREIDGSGIGLAVCQKIVERAGGRIWVESQPGQGSTFFFTLPRDEQSA